ncbi:Nephrocystin-3 [Durusdinium trenchii]|uniref:Nephrocystin-3 n=1 Tax=Durusdinium trenchii TaxID=1381693 RepID=A0ABP0IZ30_9DINO
MSIRSVPTQPYMGPSALQIAPGGAQRAGPTQVSPGTTTKWNGGVQFDQSFPKPISAVKESFQPEEAEESDEGSDCCSGYSCRWISDHPAKLFLLFMALGVFVLTIVALISGLNTLSSNAFFYYSKFAWEQWFPSFFVIMVMLMLLTLVAMAVICFAVFLSWVERRSLIRAFYISSLSLGVIMLSLALFCWLYGNRAKPYVIRAGNLLCQDPKIWHCSGSSARRLDELNETEDSELGSLRLKRARATGPALARGTACFRHDLCEFFDPMDPQRAQSYLVDPAESGQVEGARAGGDEGELLAPCPCRGSLRFAHLECLKKETVTPCEHAGNLRYVAPAVLDLARLALEWAEADWGPKNVGTLICADHLGRVLSAAGQLEAAEVLLRRAVTGLEEVVGAEHAETLIARSNLGMLLNSRGQFQEAETQVRRAWEGSRSRSGPSNAETLVFGMNLAVVLRELNRPREAEPLLREALQGLDEVKGKQHPDTLAAASHLSGLLLHLREDLGEAEPLARRAWEGSLRHFGPDHPRSLCASADLGLLLLARERPKEGETLLRSALEGFQKQLGESHPQVLSTAADLGTALYSAGRKEEALIPLRLALEGRRKLLGPEHLRSLASAHNLGVALADLHEIDEAKKLLQASWQGRAQKLGATHFRTMASGKRLLPLLQGDEEALAAQVLRSLWEGETVNLGASHPRAVQAARRLAQWLARRQLLFEAEAVLAHALAEAEAAEEAEAEVSTSAASEDERAPSEERAARFLQSTLLGSSFSPATCLAKLAAAQRRPSPCKVLSADLQDLQDRLEELREAEEAQDEDEERPSKKRRSVTPAGDGLEVVTSEDATC